MQALTGVFIGALVGIGVTAPMIWYAARKAQARKCLLEEIAHEHAHEGEAARVRYCTEKRFRRFWRIFPWEGVGILVESPHGIVFHGRSVLDAKSWQVEFEGAEAFQYIGRVIWPNGLLAWIMAKANDGSLHYFSSETGTFILGSKLGTAKILLDLK